MQLDDKQPEEGMKPKSPIENEAGQLSLEAQRALAEAGERRRQAASQSPPPAEFGGRSGPDPVRYGDWETGGIASDF
jgi:hypothetical protein